MKTNNLRVSLSFSNGTDRDLERAARKVLQHVYDNPAFPEIPVPETSLKNTISAFADASKAHANGGGRPAASERNSRRIALVRLLQQLAFHVQLLSADDLPKLLSSGFKNVETHCNNPELGRILHC